METLEAINQRVSYRGVYKKIPVPENHLDIILKAGLAAPSGCNKQTTSLIAINDPIILKSILEFIDVESFASAPAIICVLTQRIFAYRDKCYSVQDYSAAIQNMLLAIVDLGYHSCWVEGHITDADNIGRKMADVLSVPKNYDLVCFLPIGYADQASNKTNKKPFEQRAWFNGFKKEK